MFLVSDGMLNAEAMDMNMSMKVSGCKAISEAVLLANMMSGCMLCNPIRLFSLCVHAFQTDKLPVFLIGMKWLLK